MACLLCFTETINGRRFVYFGFQSEEWKKVSGMNNLNAVYQLHCQGEPLEKETRDVFVKGTMADVRADFQVG